MDLVKNTQGTPADGRPAVLVRDLRTVARRRPVLDGVTLQVERGEVVGVLGLPGAGCTALVRALAGLDYRARGQMLLLPRTGHLPQDPRLPGWRRARAVVASGSERADREAAMLALQRAGLDGKEDRRVGSLDHEERRRVALARTVVDHPSVLLLDEPTLGLEPAAASALRATIGCLLAEDRPAAVIATSDVDESILLADRVLVLDGGTIIAEVTVDLSAPRRSSDPGFRELRSVLLDALGVGDDVDGATA